MSRSQGGTWMDVDEAAAHLGVDVPTLYRLIDRGDLPAYRIGDKIRLRRHEVDAYVDKQLGPRRSYRATRRGEHVRTQAHRAHASKRAPRTAKRPRSRPPA